MTRDVALEAYGNYEYSAGLKHGHKSGYDDAADAVMAEAVKLFKQGDDAGAAKLRTLAEQLRSGWKAPRQHGDEEQRAEAIAVLLSDGPPCP